MRGLFVSAIILLTSSVSLAQAPLNPATLFIPSPAGVAVSVGKWIYDQLTGETVYYIEVAETGATVEQARQNGFRLAVEKAIGSIVASESEAHNGRLTRDEIISYSSGYVDRFEIVRTQSQGNEVQVYMKVWVRRSSIANRGLNSGKKDAEVDGMVASASVDTLTHERVSGDRLLQVILNDYPRRAFNIKIGKTQVNYNSQRQTQLDIPITVSFSEDYLKSLWSVLSATQNANGNMAEITVTGPGFFGIGGSARYTDTVKYQMLSNAMLSRKPMIKVTLIDEQNQPVYTVFYNMPALTHDGVFLGIPVFVEAGKRTQKWFGPSNIPYQMAVNGDRALPATVTVPLDSAVLAKITRVDMEMVSQ